MAWWTSLVSGRDAYGGVAGVSIASTPFRSGGPNVMMSASGRPKPGAAVTRVCERHDIRSAARSPLFVAGWAGVFQILVSRVGETATVASASGAAAAGFHIVFAAVRLVSRSSRRAHSQQET